MSRAALATAGLLLIIFLILCLSNIFSYSPTYDELKFLGIGQELASGAGWQTEMSVVHAPLSFYTHGFLLKPFRFAGEIQRLHWARVTMLLYAMALGALIFAWAAELFSAKGGLIALVLYVFNSNILAHSSLITTDIIYACFSLFLLYSFWKYMDEGAFRWAIAAGISLGLALLSKYSAVLWFFLLPIFALVFQNFPLKAEGEARAVSAKQMILSLVGVFVIALLVLNIGYGFSGTFCAIGHHHYQSRLIAKLAASPLFSWIPAPLPYPFVRGYDAQKYISEVGHPSFLMGMRSTNGWWYYYPLAFLLKMPLAFWPLLLLAGAAVFRETLRKKRAAILLLALSSLVILCAHSFLSRSQAGFRYVIVALPPLFIVTGASADFALARWKKVLVAGLTVFYITPALWVHPHHIAYFSEIFGGPKNGYKWLSDSNLDWGQDLDRARQYVQASRTPVIVNPGILPVSGRILINATTLQDCFSTVDIHTWLREFEPIDSIGYSWLIFDIDEEQVLARADKRRLPDDYYLAAFDYARDRPASAEDKARAALQSHPQLSEALYLLGLSQMAQGKIDEALDSFSAIPHSRPLYVEAQKELSFLSAIKGETISSSRFWKQAVVEDSLRAYAHRLVSPADVSDGDSLYSDAYKLHNNKAFFLWAEGNLPEAEREMRAALEIEPDFAEGLANLAIILEERGAFAEASRVAEHYYSSYLLLKHSPYRDYRVYYEDSRVMLGNTLEMYPKPDADVLRLKYHLSVQPHDCAALNQLAVLLMKTGRFAEACNCLTRGLSEPTADKSAFYTNLAVLYTEKKMFALALDACKKALAIDPDNFSAAGLRSSLEERQMAANRK